MFQRLGGSRWLLAAAALVVVLGCVEEPREKTWDLVEVLAAEEEVPEVGQSDYWRVQRYFVTREWELALQLCRGWPERPNCQAVLNLEGMP